MLETLDAFPILHHLIMIAFKTQIAMKKTVTQNRPESNSLIWFFIPIYAFKECLFGGKVIDTPNTRAEKIMSFIN